MNRPKSAITVSMRRGVLLAAVVAFHVSLVTSAHAARVDRFDQSVDSALRRLYSQAAGARALREKASAVLVFPRVVETGTASGERGGAGALREHGIATGYYRSRGSFRGVDAGIESFGYVLFFMSPAALDSLHKADDWEIGTGPKVVVVDEGTAKEASTARAKGDICAFV